MWPCRVQALTGDKLGLRAASCDHVVYMPSLVISWACMVLHVAMSSTSPHLIGIVVFLQDCLIVFFP